MQGTSPSVWRKSQKLSLAKAAALVGVTGRNPARAWQRWETGKREPPLSVVLKTELATGGVVTAEAWNATRQAFLNAGRNRDDGGKAVHTAGPSPGPNPEIVESPLPVRGSADPAATPAPTGG